MISSPYRTTSGIMLDSDFKYFKTCYKLTHTPIQMPKHPYPVQKYPTTKSAIPKQNRRNPTMMCTMAKVLAMLAAFASVSAILTVDHCL